jgi:hypothetical protein
MNMLLITEAFPPAPVVGSFRAYKVARAFRDGGASVHVMTMRGGADDDSESGEFEPGITWERITPWPGPRQAYLAARARFRRTAAAAARTSGSDMGPQVLPHSSPKGRLRRVITGLITLPDDRQGFVPAVARALRRRREAFDFVYSTAPCFSALLAGRHAASILGTPWYAELRDPWIGNASRTTHADTPLVGALDRWLERWCLRSAAGIVMVTPQAAELYRQRFGRHGVPVIAALNGIDSVASLHRRREPGALRIVYAGSVYPPRNPTPLIQALGAVYDRVHAGKEAQLTFVGADGWDEAPGLAEAVAALPAAMRVVRLPWLPQHEARVQVEQADLLLLPAQRWRLQIPNKIYDYLGSRVPVLAIVESGSDTESMLAAVGGHFLTYPDSSPADVEQAAQSAMEAALRGGRAGDDVALQEWTTSTQMSGLVHSVLESAQLSERFVPIPDHSIIGSR